MTDSRPLVPVTPYNWRLMSAAQASQRMRPTSEDLLSEHIKEEASRVDVPDVPQRRVVR